MQTEETERFAGDAPPCSGVASVEIACLVRDNGILRQQLADREEDMERYEALQHVFSSLPIPVLVTDFDLTVTAWSSDVLTTFGFLQNELLGKPAPFVRLDEATTSRGKPRYRSECERLAMQIKHRGGKVFETETLLRTERALVPVRIRASAVFGDLSEQDGVLRPTPIAIVVVLVPLDGMLDDSGPVTTRGHSS